MKKRVGLIQARKAAGYSQESFAEALDVDRSTVVRWESGEHEPLPYVRPKMAGLLSVSREELKELLRSPAPVHRSEAVPTAGFDEPSGQLVPRGSLLLPVVIDGHPTVVPLDMRALAEPRGWPIDDGLHYARGLDSTLHAVVELSRGDVKRRNFVSATAVTAAAFVEPALFALTEPPVADAARDAAGRRIGMADVQIITSNVAQLRRLDFRYGSGRIRERAVQLLHRAATTLLHGSYSDSTGRALLTAVAQAARLAASIAADVGDHGLAQRYYIQALNLAMNGGNRLFAANILSDMSRLTIQNVAGRRCARHAVAWHEQG